MSAPPKITVMIPTLNRPGAIVDTVGDMLAQTHDAFEIVVVDASPDENQSLTRQAQLDQRLRVFRIPPRGTCFARNTGVRRARGEVVVFLDDDVRVRQRDFLNKHAEEYADPTVGGVGGRVLDANTQLNRQQTGPVCRVTATGRIFANATSLTRQDINAPRGGNMSFRRQIILQVGWFDEQFRGNAMREETDFSLRVVQAGWRIVYQPAATLTHLALAGGSRSADRIAWYRDFFFNESYFFLKHFPRVYLPLLWARKLRPILACWLYYGRGRWSALTAPWYAFADAWRLTHQSRA